MGGIKRSADRPGSEQAPSSVSKTPSNSSTYRNQFGIAYHKLRHSPGRPLPRIPRETTKQPDALDNPSPDYQPQPLPPHHRRRVVKFVGCNLCFCPGVGPILFCAFNKGNPARIPRGFLIGSSWVWLTSLPGCSYWPQGEML